MSYNLPIRSKSKVGRTKQNEPNDTLFCFWDIEYGTETLDIFGITRQFVRKIDKNYLNCGSCGQFDVHNDDVDFCLCADKIDTDVSEYSVVLVAGTKTKKARIICCRMVSSETEFSNLIQRFVESSFERQETKSIFCNNMVPHMKRTFTHFIDCVKVYELKDTLPENFVSTLVFGDIYINRFGSPRSLGNSYASITFFKIQAKFDNE